MPENKNTSPVCLLDYLVGTLATAYRGMVTSLVMKDCCIREGKEAFVYTGKLLSLPKGDYDLSLMQGGREVARTRLDPDGSFELTARSSDMDEQAGLQMDLVQKGRHIGTFLLRRAASGGGQYASAMEIAGELGDVSFKRLDEMLAERPGIQEKGQRIITAAFSTKKDWPALSNDINTLARDLFWADRDAYRAWFPVFARFALRAVAKASERKTAANALDLLELPLEREEDDDAAHGYIQQWMVQVPGADLTPRYRQTVGLARRIQSRFPAQDISPLLRTVLDAASSLDAPVLSDALYDALDRTLDNGAVEPLIPYIQTAREKTGEVFRRAKHALDEADHPGALDAMRSVELQTFHTYEMAAALFGVLEQGFDSLDADTLSLALGEAFTVVSALNADEERSALSAAARLLHHAITGCRPDAALTMLKSMREGEGLDVLINAEMAGAVLRSGNENLVSEYRDALMNVRVPPPSIQGVSDETWAERSNPLHLKRLTGLMEVLSTEGAEDALGDVLIRLVANLYIGGVFIPDDKLFQRQVTAFLNARMPRMQFLASFLLLRKFPVYFNDVGASGLVRELTTDIDAWGNDPVVYFLRKQVHVNASSNNIRLVEAVIRAWATGEPGPIEGLVPDDILGSLDADLLGKYRKAITPVLSDLGILNDGVALHLKRLVRLGRDGLSEQLSALDASDEIQAKVRLLLLIYVEIMRKYAMAPGGRESELDGLLERLEHLRATALSKERTQAQESFYFKRHIAFGIPSVIGTYKEPKFDAVGDFFRLLEEARLVLEGAAVSLERGEAETGPHTMPRWAEILRNVHRLLEFHGIRNCRAQEFLSLLIQGGLYLSQAVDLLRSWQRELTWEVEWFYRTFHGPLVSVLKGFPSSELPDSLRHADTEDASFFDRATDTLMRDIISSVTGLDELDRLLNGLVRALDAQVQKEGDALWGEPIKAGHYFYPVQGTSGDEARRLAPLLGGKGSSLMVLADAGFDVPSALVFPSLGMRDYDAFVDSSMFSESLRDAIVWLEKRTNRTFGRGKRPLFLSARSGSFISMPGILETILYVGMNEETRTALSLDARSAWVSWDAKRRFVEQYAIVVLGIDSDELSAIEMSFLAESHTKHPRDLEAWQVQLLVSEYLGHLGSKGLSIPEDPVEQLKESIRAIYASWHSGRANDFRHGMGVSEQWGTAVVLMEMVMANAPDAGASVFFTRNPMTLESIPYGETRRMSTGDDLVGGGAYSRPLSHVQAEDWETLDETDPELYRMHVELARRVEDTMGLPQEIEAAYLRNEARVLVLQTKRMEFQRGRKERFDTICRMESSIIGRGIGVHGGALSGAVTFAQTVDEIHALKEKLGDMPVILVRRETSTDDVSLMSKVDGILTTVGGAASHAAILAQKFGITAVVGSPDVRTGRADDGSSRAVIGDYEVYEGMPLSIDGSTGAIYSGVCKFTVKEGYY